MTPPRRRALLAVPALLVSAAAMSLLPALGAPGGARAPHPAHAAAPVPVAAVTLRQDMRALWEQHVTWTRMVIVDLAADSPSLPASEARLLRNQADIGRAVGAYYGRAAGRRLTALLRAHILIAADVLTAARSGDAPAVAAAQARWRRNADAIAAFLTAADPTAWPRREMRAMMRRHLALTTQEAVARLTGDWAGDVRAFDRVHLQALSMADMLSAGIIHSFPARFR